MFLFFSQIFGPKTLIVHRKDGHGFGFTLRHFIVYPPESCTVSTKLQKHIHIIIHNRSSSFVGYFNLFSFIFLFFVCFCSLFFFFFYFRRFFFSTFICLFVLQKEIRYAFLIRTYFIYMICERAFGQFHNVLQTKKRRRKKQTAANPTKQFILFHKCFIFGYT